MFPLFGQQPHTWSCLPARETTCKSHKSIESRAFVTLILTAQQERRSAQWTRSASHPRARVQIETRLWLSSGWKSFFFFFGSDQRCQQPLPETRQNFSRIKKPPFERTGQSWAKPGEPTFPPTSILHFEVEGEISAEASVEGPRRALGVDLGRDVLTNRSAGSCGRDVGRSLAPRLEVYVFNSSCQFSVAKTWNSLRVRGDRWTLTPFELQGSGAWGAMRTRSQWCFRGRRRDTCILE